jgi:hypothetical protein
MTIQLLTFKDLVLAPICLLLLFFMINYWANKNYKGTPLRKYILPAFSARILGCIFSALLYQYYYGTPDDANCYYETSLTMSKIIKQNPSEGLDILVSPIQNFTPHQWQLINQNSNQYAIDSTVSDYKAIHYMNPAKGGFRFESNAFLCRIGAVLALLTYDSYLCMGFLLVLFMFFGCWQLFMVFNKLYPKAQKELAFSILFLPSVCFWGSSGLLRETPIMGALCFFVYYAHRLFTEKFKPLLLFKLLLSFAILAILKIYLGMAVIVSFLVWLYLHYQSAFKTLYNKVAIILVLVGAGFLIIHFISKDNRKFNLNNILNYAYNFQESTTNKISGSNYNLGETTRTPLGLLSKIPQSINVALFRPYVWEVKKGIQLVTAVESLIFLFFTSLTFYHIFKIGVAYTVKKAFSPIMVFCLLFALILFFMVGFTSSNFGLLARYRMPALPFYCIVLSVLYTFRRDETLTV